EATGPGWVDPPRPRTTEKVPTGPSVVVLVVEVALLPPVTSRTQQRLGQREHGLLQGGQALAHVVVRVLDRLGDGLLELVTVRSLLELVQDRLHGSGDVPVDLVQLGAVVEVRPLQQLGQAPVHLADLQSLRELVAALAERLQTVVDGLHPTIHTLEVPTDTLELALDTVDPAVQTVHAPVETVEAAVDPVEFAFHTLEASLEVPLEAVETIGESAEFVVDLAGDLSQVRVHLAGEGLVLTPQAFVQGTAVRLDLFGEGLGQCLVPFGCFSGALVGVFLDEGPQLGEVACDLLRVQLVLLAGLGTGQLHLFGDFGQALTQVRSQLGEGGVVALPQFGQRTGQVGDGGTGLGVVLLGEGTESTDVFG